MNYEGAKIEAINHALSAVIEGRGNMLEIIATAQQLIPFSAAFSVVNRKGQQPVYLSDTYTGAGAKEAVQNYVKSTYLLNPLYNAYLDGLAPGLYRMADLAPDNWSPVAGAAGVLPDLEEEIGYRTPGWPSGLQELALTVDLPNGAMGEISLARPSTEGGFTSVQIARLKPFYPLFATAFRQVWARQSVDSDYSVKTQRRLQDFAADILTPREAQIVQMVLKGHSSLSISRTLKIAIPTVKTHRKNAYAKLGLNTQQQLFSAFLTWQDT